MNKEVDIPVCGCGDGVYVLDLVDRIVEYRVSHMDGVNFKSYCSAFGFGVRLYPPSFYGGKMYNAKKANLVL